MMLLTDQEIIKIYKKDNYSGTQLSYLADLNECSVFKMREYLKGLGFKYYKNGKLKSVPKLSDLSGTEDDPHSNKRSFDFTGFQIPNLIQISYKRPKTELEYDMTVDKETGYWSMLYD